MNGATALIAVGTELLRHGRRDTNAEDLSRILGARGYTVALRVVAGDDAADIAGALTMAAGRCGLVVVTGGLGPTRDDVTREGFLGAFGVPLREDPATRRALEEFVRARAATLSDTAARQALFPESAEILANPIGTAPGFLIRLTGDRLCAALPGVPAEMRRMVVHELLPRIEALQAGPGWRGVVPAAGVSTVCLKTSGLTEARVQEVLSGLFDDAGGCDLTLLTVPGEITFLARGSGDAARAVQAEARRLLGPHVFTEDPDDHLERCVGDLLASRGETVATAESCTGGILSALLTSLPGASRWFLQGWTVYTDRSKTGALDVPAALIEAHGAVSEAVAREMASRARARAGSDWALAITGIAGPDGGTPDKPVGTVWIALEGSGAQEALRCRFGGDRETIRMLSARCALDRLRRRIAGGG